MATDSTQSTGPGLPAEQAADPGAQRDQASAHRPRSRWGRRLLGTGITILAVIVVLVWGLWLSTVTLGGAPLFVISLVASSLSLFLVVFAVVAVWLMVLAWRIEWH